MNAKQVVSRLIETTVPAPAPAAPLDPNAVFRTTPVVTMTRAEIAKQICGFWDFDGVSAQVRNETRAKVLSALTDELCQEFADISVAVMDNDSVIDKLTDYEAALGDKVAALIGYNPDDEDAEILTHGGEEDDEDDDS